MKRVISLAILAASLNLAAFAQDINPTVTVTNIYEGEASGIVKPTQPLHIPDSVSRFNLDFDYAVFENPYQGSYDFRPYAVQIRPQSSVVKDGKLYLKGGLGYTLHPDLHLVYTPVSSPNLVVSLFANHESYFGNLWNYNAPVMGDFAFKANPGDKTAQAAHRGASDAGARLRWAWDNGQISAAAAWNNVFSSIDRGQPYSHGANYASLDLGFESLDTKLDYKFGLNLRSGADVSKAAPYRMGATEIKADFSLGSIEIGYHTASVDVDGGVQILGGDANSVNGSVAIVPSDEFWIWEWQFKVGLCVSVLFGNDKTAAPLYWETTHTPMFTKKGQWVFPRVTVTRMFSKAFTLDLGVTGGEKYASYWDFVQEHPYLGTLNAVGAFMDNTVEKVNAWTGVRGIISDSFQYNLKAGYRLVDNDLMWKAVPDYTGVADALPHLGYGNYSKAYAMLSTEWVVEPFNLKGDYELGKAWIHGNDPFFAPPVFKGSLKGTYHWGERIRAGIRGDWATRRVADMAGATITLPGYVDLGLFGEFQWRRNLSFWLNAGNLLNQTVMTDPFIAERGISFTVGAILKL